MNFRLLLVAFCLLAFSSIALPQTQELPQDKMMLVEGLVETAAGCPVVLSGTKHRRPKILKPQDGLQKVYDQVEIENISGKPLKKVIVAFRHDGPKGGMLRTDSASTAIGVGEKLDFKKSYQIGSGDRTTEGYNGVYTALVLAVEFDDGTHWVKPRTADDPMTWQALHLQPAPLVVKKCDDIDGSYRATLLTRSNQVVAYRLGVVKDLPNNFEVRLGEWMAMPEAVTPEQAEIKISATDPKVSLPQSWLFKREKVRFERLGYPVSQIAGVALFVAEVKLADGTIWKQNLTRDELMWGLHNQ